jgi:hypothetical protein
MKNSLINKQNWLICLNMVVSKYLKHKKKLQHIFLLLLSRLDLILYIVSFFMKKLEIKSESLKKGKLYLNILGKHAKILNP